jgi:antitoxin MazE
MHLGDFCENCNYHIAVLGTKGYTLFIQRKERRQMQTQVKAWGNSQGIRISKEILQEADFSINDMLDVHVSNGMITLVKPFRHKTLEERAAEFDGRLDVDGEFDWGESVGREIWE